MFGKDKKENSNEKVLYEGQPNIIVYSKGILFAMILLGFLFVLYSTGIQYIGNMQVYLVESSKTPMTRYFAIAIFLLIMIVIAYIIIKILAWTSIKYTITESRVIVEKGLLLNKKNSMPFNTIQDVGRSQSIMGRIFSVGTITLYSAYDGNDLELKDISSPKKVENLIFENMRGTHLRSRNLYDGAYNNHEDTYNNSGSAYGGIAAGYDNSHSAADFKPIRPNGEKIHYNRMEDLDDLELVDVKERKRNLREIRRKARDSRNNNYNNQSIDGPSSQYNRNSYDAGSNGQYGRNQYPEQNSQYARNQYARNEYDAGPNNQYGRNRYNESNNQHNRNHYNESNRQYVRNSNYDNSDDFNGPYNNSDNFVDYGNHGDENNYSTKRGQYQGKSRNYKPRDNYQGSGSSYSDGSRDNYQGSGSSYSDGSRDNYQGSGSSYSDGSRDNYQGPRSQYSNAPRNQYQENSRGYSHENPQGSGPIRESYQRNPNKYFAKNYEKFHEDNLKARSQERANNRFNDDLSPFDSGNSRNNYNGLEDDFISDEEFDSTINQAMENIGDNIKFKPSKNEGNLNKVTKVIRRPNSNGSYGSDFDDFNESFGSYSGGVRLNQDSNRAEREDKHRHNENIPLYDDYDSNIRSDQSHNGYNSNRYPDDYEDMYYHDDLSQSGYDYDDGNYGQSNLQAPRLNRQASNDYNTSKSRFRRSGNRSDDDYLKPADYNNQNHDPYGNRHNNQNNRRNNQNNRRNNQNNDQYDNRLNKRNNQNYQNSNYQRGNNSSHYEESNKKDQIDEKDSNDLFAKHSRKFKRS